jgi:hypothetical protein
MTKFTQDFRAGMWIGLKSAVTVYALALIACVAFSGVGFIVAPMMVDNLLTAIWGDR